MDSAAAQQSLRRHLQFLQEMGFLYLEPAARPEPGHAEERCVEAAEMGGGGDGDPVACGSSFSPQQTRSGVSGRTADALALSGSAVPVLGPEALDWPASLFSRPSRPPLEVVEPPLASRGPGPAGSEGLFWDAEELLANPGSKAARKKPEAEELDLFAEEGIDSAAKSPASDAEAAGVGKVREPALSAPAAAEGIGEAESSRLQTAPAVSLTLEERQEKLSAIAREVSVCCTCGLHESRTHVVPGQGYPAARVVFVGEGPGQTEDEQGLAFVGRAGQLLTEIIRAMQLTRDDVFICNVVKCRPPGNRVPAPDEMAACEPFLKRQLEILRPEVIVALGGVALKCLLRDPKLSITRIRGTWQRYEGIPLMPTFHPAYLLRNPWDKPKVWEDIQKVMRVFGLEPKARA